MDEFGKYGHRFVIPTQKLPYPETFRAIGAISEGGDVFGHSPLSCVLENIPTGPVKPVETRTLPVNFTVKIEV